MTASSTAWPGIETQRTACAAARAEVLPWPQFVARHAKAWQALHRRVGALVDLDPAWIRALASGHALPPNDLHVVAAFDARQQLTLVWPLQVKRQRKGPLVTTALHSLQSTFCIAADILTTGDPPTAVATVLDALDRWKQPWHWLEIEGLRTATPIDQAWQAHARRDGRRLRLTPMVRSPYLPHTGTLEDYLAQRSKRLRKKVRSMLREVDSDSRLSVRLCRTPEELREFERIALQIEQRSWKHEAGSAITSRPWEQGFYRHLIRDLGPQGGFIGALLYVDETPVAHTLDWRQGQRVLSLKSTYDQAYARRSPGHLLMVNLLDRYFADGVTEYDFLGEAEPYKLEWTTHVRPSAALRVYGRRPMARLLGLLDATRRAPAAQPTANPGDRDADH